MLRTEGLRQASDGTFAEYAVAAEEHLVPMPAAITVEQAEKLQGPRRFVRPSGAIGRKPGGSNTLARTFTHKIPIGRRRAHKQCAVKQHVAPDRPHQ